MKERESRKEKKRKESRKVSLTEIESRKEKKREQRRI